MRCRYTEHRHSHCYFGGSSNGNRCRPRRCRCRSLVLPPDEQPSAGASPQLCGCRWSFVRAALGSGAGRAAFRCHHGLAKPKNGDFSCHYSCSHCPLSLTLSLFLLPFADGSQAGGGRGKRRPREWTAYGRVGVGADGFGRGRNWPRARMAVGGDGRGQGRRRPRTRTGTGTAGPLGEFGRGRWPPWATTAVSGERGRGRRRPGTRTGAGTAGSLGGFGCGRRRPWATAAVGENGRGRRRPMVGRARDGDGRGGYGRVCGRDWPGPGMRTASAGGRVRGRPKAGEDAGGSALVWPLAIGAYGYGRGRPWA